LAGRDGCEGLRECFEAVDVVRGATRLAGRLVGTCASVRAGADFEVAAVPPVPRIQEPAGDAAELDPGRSASCGPVAGVVVLNIVVGAFESSVSPSSKTQEECPFFDFFLGRESKALVVVEETD